MALAWLWHHGSDKRGRHDEVMADAWGKGF